MNIHKIAEEARAQVRAEKARSLVNPVGSVVDVFGTGGRLRHTGVFSDDNSVLNQLISASSNQDKDALYERAVNWEIENARLQEQREYDESRLQEQRAYDDPFAQVMRSRAAGINLDVQGGSGSTGGVSTGSAAQLQSLPANPIEGQTKFSNFYDNANTIFNGINTASNLVSTFVGGYSAIADSILKFRELPSRIKFNQANAILLGAQANEVSQLLEGKKSYQKLLNSGISIDNANKVLTSLSSMRELLTADSDITPFLNAMSVDPSYHDDMKSAFKELMSTPMVSSRDNSAHVAAARSSSERDVFNKEYFDRFVGKLAELDELGLDFDIATQKINKSISEYLAASSYSDDVAESIATDASNLAQRTRLASKQIALDIQAFSNGLENLKQMQLRMEARQAELLKRRTVNGRDFSTAENEEFEYLTDMIPIVRQMGSTQLHQLESIGRELRRRAFYLDSNPTYNEVTGKTGNLNMEDKFLQQASIYYDDVVHGTISTSDVANMVTSTVLQAAGTVATAYLGSKVASKPVQTGQTVTDYTMTSNDGFVPTHRKVVQNNF